MSAACSGAPPKSNAAIEVANHRLAQSDQARQIRPISPIPKTVEVIKPHWIATYNLSADKGKCKKQQPNGMFGQGLILA
jgi:hypothetical protein